MKVKHIILRAKSFIKRNDINLSDVDNTIEPSCVHLHWWRTGGAVQNVGDFLSVVVNDYMMKTNGLDNVLLDFAAPGKKTKHLYAIGSIIDGGYQDATIWGTGLLSGDRKLWWKKIRKLDIRCVRGPETRRVLIQNGYSCPECYGDPALLMPLIYPANTEEKLYDYRVVQHYKYNCTHPSFLNPLTNDWKEFINEIVRSKLIISSSLHGIILAEAYGIPAILLAHDMNMFKYRDYYYATGRMDFPVAKSVDEALQMSPPPLPDIKYLQEGLLNSYPKDLWGKS